MDATSKRWQQVTPSQYSWEADALDALRSLLPDTDPFRVWTNFEFTDGGRIHEADALVVTPKGMFLIEIKSWSGRVTGDQGTWVQERRDGSTMAHRNVAQLNQQKARSIASLIKRNWARGQGAAPYPYIESLVWFSKPDLSVGLPTELLGQIAVSNDNDQAGHVRSLSEAIIEIGEAESSNPQFRRVTVAQSDELAATMSRIGFKSSTRTRTAGTYELRLPAFAERGATQDFEATHKVTKFPARVRIYSSSANATREEAAALRAAAKREYLATLNLKIDGVVAAIDLDETEFGPAVVFEHHRDAIRLDRFLAERGNELDTDARLRIVEQIVTTVSEMHRRRISHRMLTPESVWLRPARSHSTAHSKNPTAKNPTTNPATAPATKTTPTWEPLITDFSLAAREATDGTSTVLTYTRIGSLPAARTGAAEVVLGDPAMETFLAPEAFTDSGADGVGLDAFSIGALTYLLFARQAPASDRTEMRAVLGSSGLSVSAVVPEIDPRIEELVRCCTNPIVSQRTTSMAEILDRVALARGIDPAGLDAEAEPDPLVAEPGDVLGGRFELKRRLGKGSTAVALWCHDRTHGRDVVLKVASKPSNDERLEREGEAIANLRQENVVELYEQLTLGGRRALSLSFAGERSLAGYLRAEGPVSTDFLRRWGQDLLEAIRYLEKVGVAHRDVKPDNLGIVTMGPRKQSHLVLFDFSLAGTPADDLGAGTPVYLDPFLSDPGRQRFDLAAERYAAAVTIHEMATGETPVWGDGRSDPAYLAPDVQPTLLIEAIDPEVSSRLVEFLTRSLQRDPAKRFDTADDMARAWLAVFEDWDQVDDDPADSGLGVDGDTLDAGAGPTAAALATNLTLDDPISSLSTSRKVRSALRKVGADTIREVASLDAMKVNTSRGVALKTRRQVLRLRAAVLDRFADELASEVATASTRATGTIHATAATVTAVTTADSLPSTEVEALAETWRPDLDQLATLLVPPRARRGRAGARTDTVRALLGLGQNASSQAAPGNTATAATPDATPADAIPEAAPDADWPTATAVADRLGLTPAAVSAALHKARTHWGSSPELLGVRTDLLEILAEFGGVAGVSELADALVDTRGSGHELAEARRLANAVVRAAIEAHTPATNPFMIRRIDRRTIVAVDGTAVSTTLNSEPNSTALNSTEPNSTAPNAPLADLDSPTRHRLASVDGAEMLTLAVALGVRADQLVAGSALVPSGEVVAALRSVRPTAGRSLSDARLVRLAAASSNNATTNAASDLVRRRAEALEALRWSRAALVSAPRLSVAEITARVAARFPGVVLPPRPQLDEVLARADLRVEWSDQLQAFASSESGPGGIGTLTRVTTRRGTAFGTDGTTLAPAPDALDPELAEAIEVDARLSRSLAEGGFLALRVPTDRLAQAQRGLARYENPAGAQPAMTHVDLEATFLAHLRSNAQQRGVAWANLEGADDPADPNWAKLSILATAAVDATIDEVARHSNVVAWYPGALVRHGSGSGAGAGAATAPLDRLRDLVFDGEHPLRTLWLVVLGGTTDALPKVDGTPVPTLAASQWMDMNDAWLKNVHRAGGLNP